MILTIIKSKGFIEHSQVTEIYHYSNVGKISWHDFAKQIFKIAKIDCKLNMIKSEEFQTLAKRPKNACLYNSKVIGTFAVAGLPWKDSLGRCMMHIKNGL